MRRRWWLALGWFCALVAGLRAETPPLLDAALQRLQADQGRWAYTQRVTYPEDPKRGMQLERYDPSQHPDEAWTLVEIGGRAPTEAEVKKFKKRRAKQGERTLSQLMQFDAARVHEEQVDAVVYAVPLRADQTRGIPPDRVSALLRVEREPARLTHAQLTVIKPFRVKGIFKVIEAALEVQFTEIDPQYAPQPSFVAAGGKARVFFVKTVGGRSEVTLTDYRRVTPYDDRFEVKIGEIQALDW